MKTNADYLKNIGKNLRKHRDLKGMSQQELADLSNISKSSIQRIESGKVNSTIIILKVISECLNINVEDLIKY